MPAALGESPLHPICQQWIDHAQPRIAAPQDAVAHECRRRCAGSSGIQVDELCCGHGPRVVIGTTVVPSGRS